MISSHIKENTAKPVIDTFTYNNNLYLNKPKPRTTIIIKNINKNLTSEEICVILRDNFFPHQRAFNAIYTERKKWKIKNSGICFINFIHPNDVYYFFANVKNINYFFNKKAKCKLFWADSQGDEFIKEMDERKNQDISLDYIKFSDDNTRY